MPSAVSPAWIRLGLAGDARVNDRPAVLTGDREDVEHL
jgi:hypothetical protein